MNAAARDLSQSNLFQGDWSNLRVSAAWWFKTLLLLAVLVSALAVVYVTNLHRTTLSQLEAAEQQANRLQLQWGQLLLEEASQANSSRVQRVAEQKLRMCLPTDAQSFVLRSQ